MYGKQGHITGIQGVRTPREKRHPRTGLGTDTPVEEREATTSCVTLQKNNVFTIAQLQLVYSSRAQ